LRRYGPILSDEKIKGIFGLRIGRRSLLATDPHRQTQTKAEKDILEKA